MTLTVKMKIYRLVEEVEKLKLSFLNQDQVKLRSSITSLREYFSSFDIE